jgi:hypothetical protein
MLTSSQAQARYGIGRTTLYQLAKDRKITPRKIGPRMVRYDAEELDGLFGGPLLTPIVEPGDVYADQSA